MTIIPTTTAEFLCRAAEHYPDAPALCALGRAPLTYERLYAHVEDTRRVLNGMGIGRLDRVAVVAPTSVEAALANLAVQAAAGCIPLNPDLALAEITAVFTRLKVKAVIIAEGIESGAWQAAAQMGLPTIKMVPIREQEAGLFRLCAQTADFTPIPPDSDKGGFARLDDLAKFLLTSGTTAASKIVPVTQRTSYYRIFYGAEALGLTAQDRLLICLPTFHPSGMTPIAQSIMTGGCALVLPGFEVKTFFQALDEFRPTWIQAVATILQTILDQAPQYEDTLSRASLRCINAVSMTLDEHRSAELEKIFRAPVFQAYGSTETGGISATPLPPLPRKLAATGTLIKITEVAFLGPDNQFLPHGETGEIVARGPGVMDGYEDDPEGTARAFVNGWYRTGDIGYLDSDGYLYIVGRVKEMINRGGQKVSPAEVEQALLAHPQVAQAAAFAMPDPRLGEEVAAAVVLRTPGSVTEAALRVVAAQTLAPYKVPRRIVFVDDLPKNAVGKVLRIGLAQKLGLTGEVSPPTADFVPPRTDTEQRLAQLWIEVLGCDPAKVGIHARFVDLGGTSLSAAHLVFKARDAFGVHVTILDLFDASTVAEQAAVIEKLKHDPVPRVEGNYLIPIQPKGTRPPLYCFHALEGGVYFYRDLVPYLSPDQPIYALLAVGMDDDREPLRTVEEMALHDFQQIKAVQLRGPYFLCGYSFGGRIALETARLLYEEGHTDTDVLIIDDQLQTNALDYRPITQRQRSFGQKLESLRFALSALEPLHRRLYLQQRVQHYWRGFTGERQPAPAPLKTLPPNAQRVVEATVEAGRHYEPRPYKGRIRYLFGLGNEINVPLFKTLKLIGQGDFTIRDVPGAHRELFLPPYINSVGPEVQRWLDDTQSASPTAR